MKSVTIPFPVVTKTGSGSLTNKPDQSGRKATVNYNAFLIQ